MASAANTNGKPEIEELLPLDSPKRTVAFRSGGKPYRHVFRRIASPDWKAFFGNVRMEFADGGRGPRQNIGWDTSKLQLYSDAILRVSGFEMRDGKKPEEQPDWPRCIPRDARLHAVDLLMRAVVSATGKAVVTEAKATTVRIDALWNEATPGAMKQYIGLVHRFRSPTPEHRQRFIDAGKAAYMLAGTGRGKVVVPFSNATHVELYDALIETVDGYSVGGLPLISREQIVREMDNPHKAVSVTAIFLASVDGMK